MAACAAETKTDDVKVDGCCFNGEWKLLSQENNDDYQKSIGVGWAKRKILSTIGVLLKVSIDESAGSFSVSVKPTGRAAIESKGKLGEEVSALNAQGEEQIRVYKLDGDKMVVSVTSKDEKKKATNDIRTWTIVDGQLNITIENVGQEKGLTMKQIYQRV